MPGALSSNQIDSSSHRLSVLTSQRFVVQQLVVAQAAIASEPACIAELEKQGVELVLASAPVVVPVLAATARGCVVAAVLPPRPACSSSAPWCSSSSRQPTNRTVEMWSPATKPMTMSGDCPPADKKVVDGPPMAESFGMKAEHSE